MKINARTKYISLLIFIAFFGCQTTQKNQELSRTKVEQSSDDRARSEAKGTKWVISTQGRASSDAAHKVLSSGGNIIDAAISASFAIGVERPQSTGLGGGGFLIYRDAKTKKIHVFDFRERSPKRAHTKMFLDSKGEVIENKSVVGLYAVAVPGFVKGMQELHQRFGTKPLHELIQPAIDLAENGLTVYPYLERALEEEKDNLKKFAETKKIFIKENGEPYKKGEIIYQKDLAKTLRRISDTDGKDFYEGQTSKAIVETLSALGIWMDQKDLKNYKVKKREPIVSRYKDYKVVSMPPPSSGGAHIIQMLNLLESQPLKQWGEQSVQSIHAIATAMQIAFVDRARYMGDPDFVKIPVQKLISKKYAQDLSQKYFKDTAWKADEISKAIPLLPESSETSHFSIMDQEGNVVVSTQTINGWFGSAIVAKGTGIVLNNEMDDFSAKPGSSNMFGAIGSTANAVQPGKTPLSSMTPTIIFKDDIPVLALGAPGGTRIITCVLQTILNRLEFNLSLYDSIALARFHQQWQPDQLTVEEKLFSQSMIDQLKQKGHNVKEDRIGCAVMAISREMDGSLTGVSEVRDFGKALAF